ncbi:MAG: ErfK/YbiS/YcfS/YnhG family protein [Caulobacter sp.]|nr:ErfK/YbiS/YcfS/YnhG family protein [Caulobacter sp.]
MTKPAQKSITVILATTALAAVLAACSEPAPAPAPTPGPSATLPAPQTTRIEPQAAMNTDGLAPPGVMPSNATASASPIGQAIDAASFALPANAVVKDGAVNPPLAKAPASAAAAKTTNDRNRLIRAEVLLDRARFSPGVIDGQGGTNLKLALTAYQGAHGMPQTGLLDEPTFAALTAADGAPVMQDYTITAEDAAGPYTPKFAPDDYAAMSKLPKLGYATPREALAERFHMDENLLAALNPGADFAKAGSVIVVTAPRTGKLAPVAAIEVDKALGEVRAYDEGHKLLAVYPATVGSTERPAPDGEWAVRAVAPHPTYTFDPTRLTYGKLKTKVVIAAGPNNPVGAAWIDLTKDTFGIHGAPDPRLINKRASHGCVRLTNWDVVDLAAAVKTGAKVTFMGAETRAKT